MPRRLNYGLAINEAFQQMLESDRSVFLMGQGVNSPWYVGQTTTGLKERFGADRVYDTPVAENTITGAGIGAALAGMRPVVIHPRMDFALLAIEQIVNQASNWHYMFGGRVCVPIVMRPIINRGGEQAAQHSQALQAMYGHIPGLKVVMPSTAYDAKGLMIAAIRDDNPVIYIDDRWLYSEESEVPEEMYEVPIGKAAVRREGRDLTIVATSFMCVQSMLVAQQLAGRGLEVEVIDLRSIKPLDEETIIASVTKTGRLIVAETGWLTYGVSAEIAARVVSRAFAALKSPIQRVALPDVPAPMSAPLEQAYYPTADTIARVAEETIRYRRSQAASI
jgi:acetoin:2,6-dichlorophenolindophenol oxidoreductase subunit beta